jgi:hypothetical protein
LTGDLAVKSQCFLEPGALLESFAGTVLIGPESRIADQCLELVEFALAGIRVKGTSGRLRFVS